MLAIATEKQLLESYLPDPRDRENSAFKIFKSMLFWNVLRASHSRLDNHPAFFLAYITLGITCAISVLCKIKPGDFLKCRLLF